MAWKWAFSIHTDMIILLWHNNRALETCVLHVAIAHISNTDLISFKWNYFYTGVTPLSVDPLWSEISTTIEQHIRLIFLSLSLENHIFRSLSKSLWNIMQTFNLTKRNNLWKKHPAKEQNSADSSVCTHIIDTHTHTVCVKHYGFSVWQEAPTVGESCDML